MRKYLFIFFNIFTVFTTAYSQTPFHLTGSLRDAPQGKLYFTYQTDIGKIITDTAKIDEDTSFVFLGTIRHPVRANISFESDAAGTGHRNTATFFLSGSNIKLKLRYNSFDSISVEGSPVHDEEIERTAFTSSQRMLMQDLQQKLEVETKDAERKKIANRLDSCKEEIRKVMFQNFDRYPESYITAFGLRLYLSELNSQQLERYYKALGTVVQESSYGIFLLKELENLKAASPGVIARDFRKVDINGDSIILSQFRNKNYILLDFWASWCIPCRKGNPALKEIYTQYRRKGLEIIGVADDDRKPENWRKAIEEDQLPWIHVLRGYDKKLNLNGEFNPFDVNGLFAIRSLPTKILIDKNGIIIGRYNESEDQILFDKLQELLK